jgi:hypothetical protein
MRVLTEAPPTYDRIGLSYSEVRRADPRFEAVIWERSITRGFL